ncbi:MAG: hypothetical protein K2K96_10090 [Lachnospiraceae bacterium]|nr:hypothetical protein [Lachnospiraceae bacterium]
MNENGYGGNEQYDSLQENLPEGMMERLPERVRNKIEDVMAEAGQQNSNPYENVDPDIQQIKMNPAIGIIAVIIGFGGTFVFGPFNVVIAILCLGIMTVIFGIGIVTDENFVFYKHANNILFLIIGILMVLLPGYHLISKNSSFLPKLEGKSWIGVICILLGVLIIILSSIAYNYLKNNCTERVQAVCVHIKRKREIGSKHTHITYAPVYEFQFRGNTYCVAENYRDGKMPSIGSKCDLFINPYVPKEFYRKDDFSIVLIWSICMMFILIGVLICI